MNHKCKKAYEKFHHDRLVKLDEFVSKKKARMIKSGFSDSGPVYWECVYAGMKKIQDFKERKVWEAAWKACLEQNKIS